MIDKETLTNELSIAIREGNATLFIGAGLSAAAGYPDWPTLLNKVGESIGLDASHFVDFPSLAQYCVSIRGNNFLYNVLSRELSPTRSLTNSHKLLPDIPFKRVWTTNYDKMLEESWRQGNKKLKVIYTNSQFATFYKDPTPVLFKMHGTIDIPKSLVLTEENYDEYTKLNPGFVDQLSCDFASSTILFLGLSFDDPNLKEVLKTNRVKYKEFQKTHYAVVREPSPSHYSDLNSYRIAETKFDVFKQYLKRNSIETICINDYEEIEEILFKLRDSTTFTEEDRERYNSDISKYGDYNSDAYKTLIRLPKDLEFNNIYKNRLIRLRLNRAQHYISDVISGDISVFTWSAHEYSTAILTGLMKTVSKDEEYITISNINFWTDDDVGRPEFLEENIEAVRRGANVRRILLIDSSQKPDPKMQKRYDDHVENVLEKHMKAIEACTRFKGTMDVYTLPLLDFKEPHNIYGHFAITSIFRNGLRESVLIIPYYRDTSFGSRIEIINMKFGNDSDANNEEWGEIKIYLDKFERALDDKRTAKL